MWFPSDDGFFAAQSQEHVARAQAAIAAASANASAANATDPLALSALRFNDEGQLLFIGCATLSLALLIVLCGVCRCYISIPCPCCYCYMPCFYGFCLKSTPERECDYDYHHHHHHHHHRHRRGMRGYPGALGSKASNDASQLPSYASALVVDMEEPLLGPPAYSQPPRDERSPPAYHNVPTAPPLS